MLSITTTSPASSFGQRHFSKQVRKTSRYVAASTVMVATMPRVPIAPKMIRIF